MLGEHGEMPPGYAFVGRGCHSFRSERGRATTPEGASVSSDDARNAAVGSDDKATSSAVEANRLLKAVLDAQAARAMGGAAKLQGEGVVTQASRSGGSGRLLSAGRRGRAFCAEGRALPVAIGTGPAGRDAKRQSLA
jgi:hypothetical protein